MQIDEWQFPWYTHALAQSGTAEVEFGLPCSVDIEALVVDITWLEVYIFVSSSMMFDSGSQADLQLVLHQHARIL